MDITQLYEKYWFHDGAIKSFHLDIQNNTIEVELLVKLISKSTRSKQVEEKDLIPCTLKLTFEDLIEVSLSDIFPTQGHYIDFSFNVNNGQEVGISFNIHDSSNYVYEKDNWVIKAKRLLWTEV